MGAGRDCYGQGISKEAFPGARPRAQGFVQMPSPNTGWTALERPPHPPAPSRETLEGVWRTAWAPPPLEGLPPGQAGKSTVRRAGRVGSRGGVGVQTGVSRGPGAQEATRGGGEDLGPKAGRDP